MSELKINGLKEIFEVYKSKVNENKKVDLENLQSKENLLKTFADIELINIRERISDRDIEYWGDSKDKRVILSKLDLYVKTYNEVNVIKKKLEEQEGIKEFKELAFIIKRFNDKAIDYMIEGHTLNMFKFGKLYIKRVKRKTYKGRANPVESGKNRYELLERGLIPKCPECPNGHDWIVFYTDPYRPQVYWSPKSIKIKKSIKEKFLFVPTCRASKDTFVGRIYAMLRRNPDVMINFIR